MAGVRRCGAKLLELADEKVEHCHDVSPRLLRDPRALREAPDPMEKVYRSAFYNSI